MIPPSSPGRGPPFILLPIFTGVPILRVAVGASVIATGKIGGAFHASLLCPSRSLSPYFKLVRELSFSIGGRRIFDFIGGVLPGVPSSEEFLFSFFVGYGPTSLAPPVCVASCICFATLGGAFAEVLPLSQDYGVRQSSSLHVGLFVMFPFELTQHRFVREDPLCFCDAA